MDGNIAEVVTSFILWKYRGIMLGTKVKRAGEGLCVPNSTLRSEDLDDEKSREEES